ncbi:MAG: aminoglycoside phosphotransferase family protein [Acidimicrobiales bacterium]
MLHPASGAWADLIPISSTDKILYISAHPSARAVERLRERAEAVHLVSPADLDSAVHRSGVVVCEHLDIDSARQIVKACDETTTVALVADNRISPLRSTGSSGWTPLNLAEIRRTLGAETVAFGLLRSSEIPTTALRTDLPHLGAVVLGPTASGSGKVRRVGIEILSFLARHEAIGPILPAWLALRAPTREVPSGRIGVAENDQGAVIFGNGPDAVEKVFRSEAEVAAVRTSLSLLHAAGLDPGGRILAQPSRLRLRLEWVPGTVLDANSIDAVSLALWTERAAHLLGRIHGSTRRIDGSVRCHGDYWLGAVVVDDGLVRGVIDWTDSRWGDPAVDLDTLTSVAHTRDDLDRGQRAAVIAAAEHGYRSGREAVTDVDRGVI